jgi:hypothetical protein
LCGNSGLWQTSPVKSGEWNWKVIRRSDPGKIIEAFHKARLAMGNMLPSHFESFSRMIESIVASEQQQAMRSEPRS